MNFEKMEMPLAAKNAKTLLEEYLNHIQKIFKDDQEGDSQGLANEQKKITMQTQEQISSHVKNILSSLEAGDPQPVMRFIASRNFNSNADAVLTSEPSWDKALDELKAQYGEVKAIEKE